MPGAALPGGQIVLLIGEDTKSKHKYVRWEAEVSIDKGCTIIGANINGKRDRTSIDARRSSATSARFSSHLRQK